MLKFVRPEGIPILSDLPRMNLNEFRVLALTTCHHLAHFRNL